MFAALVVSERSQPSRLVRSFIRLAFLFSQARIESRATNRFERFSVSCLMKSPFPGMDPYLERHWPDVHSTFMVYAKQQLNGQLPSELRASVEECLSVAAEDERSRVVYPDVSIAELRTSSFGLQSEPSGVIVADPFEIPIPMESPPLRHLEIVDVANGNRIVTVIELLSPANKMTSAGRAAYRKKQTEYIQGMVNLVEIDLLRQGDFVLAMPESEWPKEHQAPYKVCIRRVNRPWVAAGIGIPLAQKLPNIAIPLRSHDRDIVLELQPIIDACYQDGRYYFIDYGQVLNPPLTEPELNWVKSLRNEGSTA
jgi:hypothetical protein